MNPMTYLNSKVAEIKLSYENKVKPSEMKKIGGAKDCYETFIATWDQGKIEFVEQFKIMLLNRANKVLGICEISTGSVSGTLVEPRLVFAAAVKANASGIILAHNHPSGNLKPSRADELLTEKLRKGGELLDIVVLDHLIVTTEGFYSFADEGHL